MNKVGTVQSAGLRALVERSELENDDCYRISYTDCNIPEVGVHLGSDLINFGLALRALTMAERRVVYLALRMVADDVAECGVGHIGPAVVIDRERCRCGACGEELADEEIGEHL